MEVNIYYFSAPWCGPCKQLGPLVDELSKEFKSIGFIKINTDENPDVAAENNVISVPTLIAKQNGETVGRLTGAQTKSVLRSWLKSYEQ